ncbi:hypothetical protein CFAM422_000674 [Trichoderma lentiforme]|uniref:Uncharacterized protein n=1 Tax=Trichoderma lentiforme TaxID=1567552 RepID=A0A9P4XQA0_9HYPO|nr:hypothetical protein CFAM422_000674 [Trichoderma lentiforme]
MHSQRDTLMLPKTYPPPYEEHNGTAEDAKDVDSSNDKIFVPPQIMEKIMALKTHKERIRMVEEYMKKKGEIVKAKEKALSCQKRALARTIKSAKNDIKDIKKTYWETVDNILSLVAARKDEARRFHETETRKIEAIYQNAFKRVDEEYNALLDLMLISDKQNARAEV